MNLGGGSPSRGFAPNQEKPHTLNNHTQLPSICRDFRATVVVMVTDASTCTTCQRPSIPSQIRSLIQMPRTQKHGINNSDGRAFFAMSSRDLDILKGKMTISPNFGPGLWKSWKATFLAKDLVDDHLPGFAIILSTMDTENPHDRTWSSDECFLGVITHLSLLNCLSVNAFVAEQEGRILLAIQAIKKQEIATIALAARTFNVPRSTLRDRLSGRTERTTTRANSTKLTEIEEESLRKWIFSLDNREAAPWSTTVRETTNILLATRETTPVQTVGEKWIYNFIKRHPKLSNRFSRRYNYERAKYKDLKIISEYIDNDNIYNFDETGFAMGLTATVKVITRNKYYGRRSLLQPGNREWALPPYVIFKGKIFIESWFDDLPDTWKFEISPNGWTSNEIGLR
ncbi:uncharacterized protein N7506_004449 [Penicillium brevicompactum]|uniref:uncharacterized protein n=1 Tax=Penicillium brevicompactum TaxID=5074 RepID=UPI0025403F55|nr:uncharacterized protein N7506_004449 [Penicillium brevicompactum]KAJ5336427.1 hypothetical protein N7506_004449 [Penicillium brevicompactum]